MKQSRKVSVLIPLYNSEQYIGETLNSVLNQSWQNLEVIVVDDGSGDKGADIVESFNDQRIRLIRKQNEGASVARNVAFEYANGDYIQYLDADDVLGSHKIEKQVRLLEKSDEQCISSCNWGRFRKSTDETVPETQYINQDMKPVDWLVEAWGRGEMMQTACWLTPRSIIQQSGIWDTDFSLGDDGEFFSRVILSSEEVLFCPESLVHYRSDLEGSLSKNYSVQSVRHFLRLLKLYEEHIFKHEDSIRVREALSANYQMFAYTFYNTYPELAKQSLSYVKALGIKKLRPIGGNRGKLLTNVLGFENMLKLRKILNGPH